ncbi:ribonuclease inhibitor-like isoform X2 [Hemicordylus capensis]|uniref:ribonuclease inhibitor-like isoform X2 n=1 Tax=Hemicordylus capensis TaxID=884348 RepID=UPI0023025DAF|nr:ribonuclease inhibitor-like isoform X2 [Hemicordylus capensis]
MQILLPLPQLGVRGLGRLGRGGVFIACKEVRLLSVSQTTRRFPLVPGRRSVVDSEMDLDIQCQEFSGSKWKELVPSLRQYKTIRMDDCGLLHSNCADIASVLSTNKALTELTLNNNELGDSGVGVLCKGLMDPSSTLQKLWLKNCNLTKACCENLRSVLRAKPSLIELHLGDNNLGPSGLKVLCEGLLDPNCQLQTLHLEYCELSEEVAEALSSALRTKSCLKELNLSHNSLGDAAVKHLCQALQDANCKLQSLQLDNCDFTVASCGDLSAVLSANSSLTELCLGENKIGDAGVALLCQGLLNPNCKIQKLTLWECDITAAGCKDLSNVISTKETLRELNLIGNNIGDQGMDFLCQGLKDPNAKLQSLWLRECGLTTACCKSISSVLCTNSILKELHIASNPLKDAGVIELCEGLMSPSCNLQCLWLGNSVLTPACCEKLATLIAAKPCLEELDLSYNELRNEAYMTSSGLLLWIRN